MRRIDTWITTDIMGNYPAGVPSWSGPGIVPERDASKAIIVDLRQVYMPRKEIVSTDKVTAGTAPLSQATKLGNLVFVAGNTGRHPTSGETGNGIKEQTRYALERISLILDAAGSSIDNVLTNTCYVSNREDLPGFNEVYGEFFTKDRPARTTVVVNFGDPNNLVEVTSTAFIAD